MIRHFAADTISSHTFHYTDSVAIFCRWEPSFKGFVINGIVVKVGRESLTGRTPERCAAGAMHR